MAITVSAWKTICIGLGSILAEISRKRAVVLVVAAFGAGALTRQFGQGADGTATTGPTASTASREVPEEPTEDSAVAPAPDQQVDDSDDSSDSAPSTEIGRAHV